MPIQTKILATEPELVEQHVISVKLDSNWSPLPQEHCLTMTLLTYGATITHLTCPDKTGQVQDLVLGFDDWEEYIRQAKVLNPYFGATIGRTASRVAHAEFQLDGKIYPLKVSNGKDCHHGGPLGFDKRYWTTHRVDQGRNAVQLRLVDPAGNQGYPGTLETLVEFRVTEQGDVEIAYEARLLEQQSNTKEESSKEATILSLTNHTYWNLDGVLNTSSSLATTEQQSNQVLVNCSIRDHSLWLASNWLIELGAEHPVPTGNIVDLTISTTMDPTARTLPTIPPCLNLSTNPEKGTLLGLGIDQIPGSYGYDHVYLLDPSASPSPSLQSIGIQGHYPHTPHVATLRSSLSGLSMRLLTSEPALVLYAAGYLEADKLLSTKTMIKPSASASASSTTPQATYRARFDAFAGVSLEPARIPDAIHHPEWSQMVILRKGETYRQKSIFQLRLF